MPRLVSLLASVALLALLAAPALSQPAGSAYYSFCYTVQQTLPTSPYLPFSVVTSGTLQVSTSLSAPWWNLTYTPNFGYQVLNAVGTRVIVAQGLAPVTRNIIGVAPPGSYEWNDNILLPASGSPLSGLHGLGLMLDGNATYATGLVQTASNPYGYPYVTIQNYTKPFSFGAGLTEYGQPLNDGVSVAITTSFYIAPASSFSASFGCPNTVGAISIPAATLAAYNTRVSYTYCYSFSMGPGRGTYNDGNWTDQAYGTITTTGFLGTGLNGNPAALITSATGYRTFLSVNDETSGALYGTNNTNFNQTLSLSAFSSAIDAYPSLFFAYLSGSASGGGAYFSSNLLYPTAYPYFDTKGILLTSTVDIEDEFQSDSGTKATRLFVSAGGSFSQWIVETTCNCYYPFSDGTFILLPTVNATAQGLTPASLAPQCAAWYGATSTYSFCYVLDNSALTTSNQGVVTAYGTFIANGPNPREGRSAYTLTGASGVRTVTVGTTSYSQSIVSLKSVDQEGINAYNNDNLVYTTAPYFDNSGLLFTMSSGAWYPADIAGGYSVSQAGTDLVLEWTNWPTLPALYAEHSATTTSTSAVYGTAPTSNFVFQYALYNASAPVLSSCRAALSNAAAPPSLVSFSFCYFYSGSVAVSASQTVSYNLTLEGMATAFNTPIRDPTNATANYGYALQSVKGYRGYVDNLGRISVNPISISDNYYATGTANFGVYLRVDNIIYTQRPYFDSYGLAYQMGGAAAYTYGGQVVNAPIGNLYANTSNSAFDIEFYVQQYSAAAGVQYSIAGGNQPGVVNVVQDNGVSGLAGSAAVSACGAPQTIQVQFCYTLSNTFATSPYMAWAVMVSGTMTLNMTWTTGEYTTAVAKGFQVIGMTGTRTITFLNRTVTNNIIGVADLNTVNFNDNILNIATPWIDNARHGITYILDGPAYFGGGLGGNSSYVSISNFTTPLTMGAGFSEIGNPINDGINTVVTSQFTLNVAGFGNQWTCPYTMPYVAQASIFNVGQYYTPRQWSFCWTHTGGPGGYSIYDGNGNWTITSTGVITTTSFAGQNAAGAGGGGGRQGYAVTGVSGTRTYTFENGTKSVVQLVGVGGFYAALNAQGAYFIGSSEGAYVSNNVLYSTYPYFDSYGMALLGSGDFFEEEIGAGGGDGSTNVVRVFTATNTGSTAYDFQEWLLDFATGYVYYNHVGTSLIQPYTGTAINTFAQQCSFTYGTLNTYSFCYYVDNTAATGAFKGISSAYGTLTAYSGIIRNGRPNVLQVVGMNGIRTVVAQGSGSNVVYTQNIIALKYPNQDLNSNPAGGSINDNWVFSTPPYLDRGGLVFTLSSNASFPAYPNSISPDVWLFQFTNNYYYEYTGFAAFSQGQALTAPANFYFHYQLANSSVPLDSSCSARYANAALVPAPPALTTYSFCYYHLSTSFHWEVSVTGQVQLYNQQVVSPVYQRGGGYPVYSLTGLRQIADYSGDLSINVLTGLSSDYTGSEFYNDNNDRTDSWSQPPNQLMYPQATPNAAGDSPIFDGRGIMYAYSNNGGFENNIGYINNAWTIGKLFYDNTTNNFGYVNTIDSTSVYLDLIYGNATMIADNGAAAAAGTMGPTYCGEPAVKQFSMCYTITNTLATSPWLPWTVSVTALINVTNVYSRGEYGSNTFRPWLTQGYQVVGMTGTRTITYRGQTVTQKIVGVAPVNGYNFNDNIMNLQTPFFDTEAAYANLYTARHSLSFILDGPAVFADGITNSSSKYVNINAYSYNPPGGDGSGIFESDLPQNDKTSHVLLSLMEVKYDYFGTNVCTLPAANYTAPTAAQIAAYNTPGPNVAFCWSHTGGPGADYELTDGSYWTITTSGMFTTAGYLGTTATGRQAYKITGVYNAQRVYTFPNGSTSVDAIIGIGNVNQIANASNVKTESGSFSTYDYGNNIVYTSFPEIDSWGVLLVAARDVLEEGEIGYTTGPADGGTNVIRAAYSGGYNLIEWVYDPPYNLYWTNNGGLSMFSNATTSASFSLTDFTAQCLYSYGQPATMSYCYWSQGTRPSPFVYYTYGLMQVLGPVTRQGRAGAYNVRGMQGVRTLLDSTTGKTTSTNIVNVKYPWQNLNLYVGNDNILYPSYPFFDALGVVYTLYAPNGQTLPGGSVVKFADVNTYYYPNTTDYVADYLDYNALIDYGNVGNGGSVGVYTTGGAMSQCGAPATTGIPTALPAMQTYSFCFSSSSTAGGSAYQLGVSGTFSVYGTPISTGLTNKGAYAVASMTGTRWFYGGNNHEYATQNSITQVPSDWVASTVGISVSNLYYPNGTATGAPFDTAGLLFSVSGNAASAAGYLDTATNFVKLSSVAPGTALQEQAYIGSGGMLFPIPSPNVVFVATLDNGASQSTILGSSCKLTFPAGIVWGGGPTTSTGGASRSSSSSSTGASTGTNTGVTGGGAAAAGSSDNSGHNLSSGSIAGIVIGCVVGGAVLLALVLACCLLTRGALGGGGKAASTKYDTQADVSKVGQSQVEMQPAHMEASKVGEDGEHTEV